VREPRLPRDLAGADAVLEPLRRHRGPLTLAEVVRQAEAGDAGCRRVVADAGRALGVAVAGVANLLAPEKVIVGGELSGAGAALLGPLHETFTRSAIAAVRGLPVVAGVLGDRAEVLGAVALVLRESERFVAEPAPVE
jgi:predicted NBD/HSP70 family sugar kinase